MTRAEVERTVGEPLRRERRSEFDAAPVDFYRSFAVHYDERDTCCAIEFSRGASVDYDGVRLFEMPATAARGWARKLDPRLEARDGFVSRELGLSMYAPMIDEPDLDDDERTAPAESFLIFKRGYYEKGNAHSEQQERRSAPGNGNQT